MNQQQIQAEQERQERQRKQIEALTLKAGAEMIKSTLPTMQGGTWDKYTLPEKIYIIYTCAEHKAAQFIRNGGTFHRK